MGLFDFSGFCLVTYEVFMAVKVWMLIFWVYAL